MPDVPVKLPVDVILRIDRLVVWVAAHVAGASRNGVTRASVVRTAVVRGLESIENEYMQPVPRVSPRLTYRLRAGRDADMVKWYMKAVIDAHVNPRPLTSEGITQLVNGPDAFLDLPGSTVQEVFAWASSLPGWPAFGPKPLYVEPLGV